ncbi:roadblock/LC7 domain-containing protein [Actinokineospora sp. HUAS TT18]|uniref:roadblock/LC7 domain-containing protein n=1 Tax=Actinokineospora sp. HUAS TT18 TaxID=3447451 RepID=UPI003F521405
MTNDKKELRPTSTAPDVTAITSELRGLRHGAVGVTDTLVATADGLLVAADIAAKVDADTVCAMAAVDLGLARRATKVLGFGALDQTTVSGSRGHLSVYAVGALAVLVVLGDEGLDLQQLHTVARRTADRIKALLPTSS